MKEKMLSHLLHGFFVAILLIAGVFVLNVQESYAVAGDGATSVITQVDTNTNGQIDRITFSIANPNGEAWALTGATPYGLSVTDTGNDVTISSVTMTSAATANPVTIQVDLSEADGDLTYDTSVDALELVYTQETGDQTCATACIADAIDEEMNTIATGDSNGTDTEADGAAPAIVSATYSDNNTDGTVDRITVVFSETLSSPAFEAGDWDFTVAGDINAAGVFDPTECGFVTTTMTCTDAGTGTFSVDANETGKQTSGGAEPTWRYQNLVTANSITDGTNHTGTLTKALLDGAGPMLKAVTSDGSTALNGTAGISSTLAPILDFTEYMATTLTLSTTNEPTGGFTPAWSVNDTRATLNHTNPFNNGKTISVDITAAAAGNGVVTAFAGATSAAADPFSFTTSGGSSSGSNVNPVGTVKINEGAETTSSPNVTLKLSLTPSTDALMVVDTNPNFTGKDWQAYQETLPWEFDTELGEKKIYVRYKVSGQLSQIVEDTITLVAADSSSTNTTDTTTTTSNETENPTQTSTETPMANLGTSVITVDKYNAQADGVDAIMVNVMVKDANGKAINGKNVSLMSSRMLEDVIATMQGVTDENGKASFKVTSSTAGVSTLAAKVDSKMLRSTVAVTFGVQTYEVLNLNVGDLIKVADSKTVYYFGDDNKRHAFPNSKVYLAYYEDFSTVRTISAEQLAGIPLGKNVKLRPGTWLVKIQSDPKVYAVGPNGKLHWVASESIARALYGEKWNTKIIDISVAFFNDYEVGDAINSNAHPEGSVIAYSADGQRYVIMNGKKHLLGSNNAFKANRLQDKFVQVIDSSVSYSDGTSIDGQDQTLLLLYF